MPAATIASISSRVGPGSAKRACEFRVCNKARVSVLLFGIARVYQLADWFKANSHSLGMRRSFKGRSTSPMLRPRRSLTT